MKGENAVDNTVYSMVRQALCQGFDRVLPHVQVRQEDFDCRSRGCAVRCALPLRLGEDAQGWADALCARLDAFPRVFGAPLVARVYAAGGHVLFDLTKAFYDGALSHSIASLPLGTAPDEADPLFYPYHRMRMLARQGGVGCPDNAAVQQALWLAWGIEDALGHPQRLSARRQEAAQALLSMFDELSPLQRHILCRQCAQVGEAAARLLCLSSSITL